MRCELPDLKRCCFCLPLRRGLLAWGYLKLGLIMVLWLPIGGIVYFSLGFAGYIDPTLAIIVLLLIVDFGFNVSFLVAAHTKNFKLFKMYYYYIMVFTVLVTIIIFVIMGIRMYVLISRNLLHKWNFVRFIFGFSFACVNIAVQVYIMILVKSEINKLENNCQFQFVNNEAHAQVKSNLEMDNPEVEEVTSEEKERISYG